MALKNFVRLQEDYESVYGLADLHAIPERHVPAALCKNVLEAYALLLAMGIALEERNLAQVTMNLTDYTKSSIYSVFEMVKMEARRYGVRVVGSEVVGIVPMKALLDCAEYYLQIEDFSSEQVLELHIE